MNYNLIRHNIFNNWTLFRFIRLALGIFIIVEGIRSEMWMMMGLGVLFSLLPLLNMGGCSTGNCAVPTNEKIDSSEEELSK